MNQLLNIVRKYSPLSRIDDTGFGRLQNDINCVVFNAPVSYQDVINLIQCCKYEICSKDGFTSNSCGEQALNRVVLFLVTAIAQNFSMNIQYLYGIYKELFDVYIYVYEGDFISSGVYQTLNFLTNNPYQDQYLQTQFNEFYIRKLLKALCQHFQPKAQDRAVGEWQSNFCNNLYHIFNLMSKVELEKCKYDITEALLYWTDISMGCPENDQSKQLIFDFSTNMIVFLDCTAKLIIQYPNSHSLYYGLSDEAFDSLLTRIQRILLTPDFPQNSNVNNAMMLLVQDCLADFVLKSTDNKILCKIYGLYTKLRTSPKWEVQNLIEDMEEPFSEKMKSIKLTDYGMKSEFDIFLDELKSLNNTRAVNEFVQRHEDKFKEEYLPILSFFEKYVAKSKLVNFKENPQLLSFLFDEMYKANCGYYQDSKDGFWAIGRGILGAIEKQGLLQKLKKDLYEFVDRMYDLPLHPYHYSVCFISYKLDWKGEFDKLDRILKKLKKLLERDHSHFYKNDIIVQVTQFVFEYFHNSNGKNKKIIEFTSDFADLFNYCFTLPWAIDLKDERLEGKHVDLEKRRTLAGQILIHFMRDIYKTNRDFDDFIKPIVGTVKRIKNQNDDEILQEHAATFLRSIADKLDLLGNEAGEEIIKEYVESRDISQFPNIVDMYPNYCDAIYKNLEIFVDIVKEDEELSTWNMTQLLNKIVHNDYAKINNNIFKYMMSLFDSKYGPSLIEAYRKLATARFSYFQDYHTKIMNTVKSYEYGSSYLPLLPDLCQTEQLTKSYTKLVWDKIKVTAPEYVNTVFAALREIALRNKSAVAVYKSDLEKMKDNPKIHDQVLGILDVLEGRTLEKVTNDIDEQREDIENLDSRVTENEEKIVVLDADVKETKKDVAAVKLDMKEAKKRLGQIEYTMKGLDERVEQLNHMTLSHAPAWSRHVSELMNVKSDNDWRLLSMKLNYSNDDIRNWATQPDPCLSMLDEWFATHKTREATFAILNNLKEMNRLDAAEIVENALADVKNVVKDDKDEEFEKPEIFLSYQWGHQQEAKMLKKHLEMAGFKAWMDIGQMGGGDKLYAKIDDGVRSAKVIISCVSEKYAKSANCCREVNLSTNLGKPMIPLLMEKLQWPPAGPMGPIMSEYLYVQFYKNGGMQKGDTVFWMPPKFQELLMQIRYYVVPDMKLITKDSPYAGWMNPPEEIIIIPKREQKAIESKKSNTKNEAEVISPDVFISYQWDKQPQIKRLYKKLSGLGYHCWLDIMQMGGGDSLFDKIDKGIRGCRVVISCVTPKYALSANCRREVSLSGALNKPIIPLLLDNMKWPPEGPMSMVFTQLLYIGFHRKKDDKLWEGDEFNQLISKIDMNAPGGKNEQQSSSKAINNETEKKNTQTKKTDEESKKEEKNVGDEAKQPEQSPQPKQRDNSEPSSHNTNNTPPPKTSSTCNIL
ncbi:DgyrCDS3196 [Dimorphilus gyrociliatus]|uniref:DgyrCDS3196 n=1 Tax=Dimorphilus gyrociliatus TaxID=2664684 RepID=A0A7I8VF90_9ANNE|nr:DgyrCDS3196 [Dimorphilus gyrociliatus]